MKQMLAFILMSFAVCGAGNNKTGNESRISRLHWLPGTWEMKTHEGIITEEWRKKSDTLWQGFSYMLTLRGDTAFKETIRLSDSGGHLYYLPTVGNQNGAMEIRFTEKSFTDTVIIFENSDHDFPQRIIYKRISDTSILAAIEGVQNGQSRREEFIYSKK